MAELALAMPALVLLLLAAADFGRLFYVWIAVNNAARAGAQYGSQAPEYAGQTAAIQLAASTDYPGVTATPSQCTCVPGTPNVPVCSGSNYDCTNSPQATFVEVDTQAPFSTVMRYPGIPSSITVKGQAIMEVSGSG